ncbi:MAG: acyltransferase family protein [Terriglobia bacterium]
MDGLRGVAILGVVANHAGIPLLSGGFTGVDIFFVISGFLITRLLLREAQMAGTISIGNFYARRVRRLLPALATVVSATLLLGFLFLPPFGEKLELAKSAGAAAVFLANHYFLAATAGYFNRQSEFFPLLHLWSLAVEEQFYLLWPLLLLLVVKRTARVRILIGVVLTGSFFVSAWLLGTSPSAAFFLLPSRAWELGVGCLLATMPATMPPTMSPRTGAFVGRAAGVFGAALLAVSFLAFNRATPFPGPAAAVPVMGAALLIYAGMAAPLNVVSRTLASKPLVKIGLLSYSWYLWHWPLLSIVRNRQLSESNVWINCGIVLSALLCAAVTVRFIENPIRHHRGRKVGTRRVLLCGAATVVALLGFAGALGAWEKHRPPDRYSSLALKERPPLFDDCMVANQTWNGRIFLPKCDDVPPNRAPGDTRLAIVWGDSHADAWAPAVRGFAVEVREVSMGSCPPVAGLLVSSSAGVVPNCTAFNAAVLAGLKQLRETGPERKIGVVLAARWPGYMGVFPLPLREHAMPFPRFYTRGASTVPENAEALRQGLTRTLAALANLHIRALILLGGPEFRVAPLRCASVFGEKACAQPKADIEAWRQPAVEAIRQTAARFPDTRVIDPLPFFCPGDSCPAFTNGTATDYDDSHISVSSARKFVPALRRDFGWLFGED